MPAGDHPDDLRQGCRGQKRDRKLHRVIVKFPKPDDEIGEVGEAASSDDFKEGINPIRAVTHAKKQDPSPTLFASVSSNGRLVNGP
jgi:hypothetical protein